MAKASTLPGPSSPLAGRFGSLGKPEQSRLILTATAGVVCATLCLWLIVVRLLAPPSYSGPVAAVLLRLPRSVPLPVTSQVEDLRLLGRSQATATATGSGLSRIRSELGDFLARRDGRPVLVYLSAVGGTWTEGATRWSRLFATGDALDGGLSQVPLEEVIGYLKEQSRLGPILLVLDAGQVDSDRELGLYGFDPRDLLKDPGSQLSVLLACAPGQRSWVAEGRSGSVFAHYLAEVLDETARGYGLITAGEILAHVRPRVARWVAEYRGGAVQTPILLGDPGLRLRLPPPRGRTESPAPDEKAQKNLRARLEDEWNARSRLAESDPRPYRHAPLDWRRYQVGLIHAESLARSGAFSAAIRRPGRGRPDPRPDRGRPQRPDAGESLVARSGQAS